MQSCTPRFKTLNAFLHTAWDYLPLHTAWDYLRFWRHRVQVRQSNRRFLAKFAGFAVPPAELAFDAYDHFSWPHYYETGRADARWIAGLIREHLAGEHLRICEWGCGPARVIRHLKETLPGRTLELFGTDRNPRSIQWCREHIPGIDFRQNGPQPPLPFPAGSMDALYAISVFTHLSPKAHRSWIKELLRVVGSGIAVFTSHGSAYRRYLSLDEQSRFAAGQLVVRRAGKEGKKGFAAFHPPEFVRDDLLRDAAVVAHVPGPHAHGFAQDVWVARRKCA